MKSFISSIALLAAISPVSAADLPFNLGGSSKDAPTVPTSWTGFFVGGHAGYGWDSQSQNIDNLTSAGLSLVDGLSSKTKPAGWFAGVEAAANWQMGSALVAGLATDISIANIADDSSLSIAGTSVGLSHSTIDWFGTGRLRVGPTLFNDRVWTYVTGGVAYGGIGSRSVVETLQLSNDAVRFGWVGGAGAEAFISKDWTIKAEWQHIDLGSDSLSGVIPSTTTTVTTNGVHNAFDIIRVGFAYKTN